MHAPLPTFSPRRELGRTGFRATRIGIGDLGDRAVGLDACVATLTRALEAGLNVVDTAPSYEDGFSEQVVGAALRGRREGVFLIDKIDLLAQPVGPQVDTSLGRLAVESVDLFAFHNVSKLSDWQALRMSGGGLDQLAEHVRAGQVRFRGISSHHPDVLRAAIESGLCDVVMFPLGPFVDRRYVEEILPMATKRGIGTVCFKTFGAGKLLGDTEGYGRPLAGREEIGSAMPHLSVEECVRYTLTLDPDVALLGLSQPQEQDAALAAAARFSPMSAQELSVVRVRATRAIQSKGEVWWDPKD